MSGSQSGFIFHHFPTQDLVDQCQCRQISVLGFARGSLGSFYTARYRRCEVTLYLDGKSGDLNGSMQH